MRKIKLNRGFIGFLHACALALPLVMLVFIFAINFMNGYTATEINGVASESLNYENTYDINSYFTYFNTNYLFSFGIVDVDFMTLMGITSNLSYVTFINWYINYLINLELVLFLPELLLIFINMCRRLVLMWSHKISGGF